MLSCFQVLVLACTALAIQGKQCGRVQVEENGLSDRILGGHVAPKRNWPWLVEILACTRECRVCDGMCSICTGTIVSDRHVLTAAHCFRSIDRGYYKYSSRPETVIVLIKSLHSDGKGSKYDQTNINVHPGYNFEFAFPGYDVAIVEVLTPITFSDYDQPICIVDSFRENICEVAYVAGYGASSVDGTVRISESRWNVTYNRVDHQARENIVQFKTIGRCASVKTPLDIILRHSEKTICAVGNKRDTAQGDSGGPMMINRKGVWYQVGVTSIGSMFEDDDGKIKWSSLYSRLSRACEWIEEITGDDVKCASMEH